VKPFRYAFLLALSYFLVAGGYILVSDHLAATIARDVADFRRIEDIKGLLFVLVTGVLLFCAAWILFRRFARAQESRSLERRALMLMQNKAYASELAAAVAHDFNNLLLVLHAGVDELALKSQEPPNPTIIVDMRQALESARDLTKRMARAARGERKLHQESHPLAMLVQDAVGLLRRIPRLRGRDVDVVVSTNAHALLDPVSVEQILVNLLLNAADAAGEGGKILVEVHEDALSVCLSVHDNGEGLTDTKLLDVLKPFTTTKEIGLGLGLLSVRASVEASQGTLTVMRSPLGGAQFDVRWSKAS
jgi:signal transduction histidine kinase